MGAYLGTSSNRVLIERSDHLKVSILVEIAHSVQNISTLTKVVHEEKFVHEMSWPGLVLELSSGEKGDTAAQVSEGFQDAFALTGEVGDGEYMRHRGIFGRLTPVPSKDWVAIRYKGRLYDHRISAHKTELDH